MKYSTIGYILGQVLKFEGIFMLLPFLTGMIYHENEAYSYLIIGIICFDLGGPDSYTHLPLPTRRLPM